MGVNLGISQQQNQSASNAVQGQSGISGPIGNAIEGACIGIGANVSVGNKGIGITVGFTPFGNGCQSIDYGIGDLDIVQVGCDIIITRSLLGITTVETRRDPNCKEPEPPPPPPGPEPSPGNIPPLPPNSFIHFIVHQSRIWDGSSFIPSELTYSLQRTGINQYKLVLTSTHSIAGVNILGVSAGGSYLIKDYYDRSHYRDPSTGLWVYDDGSGNLSFSRLQGNTPEFNSSPGINICKHIQGSNKNGEGGMYVATFHNRLKVYTGMSTAFTDYFLSNVNSAVYQITVLDCTTNNSPPPNLFPPNQMSDCCNATTAMLRKIMKVLAVDEIEKDGIKIPNEFLAPGGSGLLKVDNYAELQLNLFRTVNRYGIDSPIRVRIKDVNKAKAGDQSVDIQFNSPAAAIQALLELAVENKGDAATRLQIQVRLAYAVTRTLKIVAGIGETIREVVKMLGSPFQWSTVRLPLEFDLSAGITGQGKSGKGFGDKPKEESDDELPPGLQANDEDTTESLLPAILTPSNYLLPVPRFVETQDDLQDFLVKILLLLGSKK